MPTKKELINRRLQLFLSYAENENLPFLDEMRQATIKYKIEHIVGMVERFLIPAKDCLKEYILSEYATIKALYPEKMKGVTIPDSTLDRMVKDITYVIKVVQL